ncbi:MAG: hypothetical protein WAM88_15135 [Nitrososphaeraceae archaeon]
MTKTRLTFGFIVVIVVVGAATLLSIDTAMNVYAQNTTMPPVTAQQNQTADPQQIKNYLTQAIQALDSGNNTKAAEQVDLAEDQLEGMTGTESAEDDEDEEIEEGVGEDADEPGDIDTNDEEDTP